MYFLYDIFTRLIILISPIIFLIRIIKGKEHPKKFIEKYTIYKNKKIESQSIWFHAVSVGELMSVIPILKKLEKNKKIKKIILTTSTTSSAKIFSKLKFKKTFHKYFPLDSNYHTKRFIKHWKPQIAVFIESEIWPNMIKNLYENNIPIIILNGRITEKSFRRWKIFPKFAKDVFNKITLAMPQNSETFKYLKLLGVKNIKMPGNIKYYGKKKLKKDNSILKKKFKGYNIWCAASTHDKEEVVIANLHKELKKIKKKLLTIIIPRHIKRSKNIINKLNKIGIKTITHTSQNKITKNTDIYLVDSYGEASKFYDLTNITFVGGSLIKHGGQNPLEPARSGNFIINGPNIKNFTEVYAFLKKNNISLTTLRTSEMKKIILEKFNYKITKKNKKKIFNIGEKILYKNMLLINEYVK